MLVENYNYLTASVGLRIGWEYLETFKVSSPCGLFCEGDVLFALSDRALAECDGIEGEAEFLFFSLLVLSEDKIVKEETA